MSAINEEEAISINFSLHRLPLKILYFRFRVEFSARACLIKGSKYIYIFCLNHPNKGTGLENII